MDSLDAAGLRVGAPGHSLRGLPLTGVSGVDIVRTCVYDQVTIDKSDFIYTLRKNTRTYTMSLPVVAEDSRPSIYPIARPWLWEYYTRALACVWFPGDISMARDEQHYVHELNDGERRLVDYILAFFAVADGLINVNLVRRFSDEVPYLEAQYFYRLQAMMEDVHATVYADMIDACVTDPLRRTQLREAAAHIGVIARMCEYMRECTESQAPLPDRLLRMACVEGVFFHGAFCVIYWLRSRGLMPGLAQANEYIARDEGMHTDFALELYRMCPDACANASTIITDATAIAVDFIADAIPDNLGVMSRQSMTQYVRSVADGICRDIGIAPAFNASNPFGFMDQLRMHNRTRGFESRTTDYGKGAVGGAANTVGEISFDDVV